MYVLCISDCREWLADNLDLLIGNGHRVSFCWSPRYALPLVCLGYADTVQFQHIFKMVYCGIFNVKWPQVTSSWKHLLEVTSIKKMCVTSMVIHIVLSVLYVVLAHHFMWHGVVKCSDMADVTVIIQLHLTDQQKYSLDFTFFAY